MVNIRAFRAVEDFESCQKFIEGHVRVLKSIGVTEVTSAKNEWAYNPAVFVIIVESSEDGRVLGGARIHAANGVNPLPIEEAIGGMEKRIFDLVEKQQIGGTGELCGLWNSMEIAGLGFGSIFLTRAAVAISTQIGLSTLFALCAKYTVKTAENVGFTLESSIGDNGTFVYPKQNMLASAVFLKDTKVLSIACDPDRERIFSLRKYPQQTYTEASRRNCVEINYGLLLNNVSIREFRLAPPAALHKLTSIKQYAIKY